MTAFRAALFTIVVPGFVTVVFPHYLLTHGRTPTFDIGAAKFSGIPVFLCGAGIYFWCVSDFVRRGRGTPAPIDPPKALVVSGLYQHVRNPMYVGILSILTGESIFFQSYKLLSYATLLWVMFQSFIIFYEEPMLKKKFGKHYEDYLNSAPRWIPKIKI